MRHTTLSEVILVSQKSENKTMLGQLTFVGNLMNYFISSFYNGLLSIFLLLQELFNILGNMLLLRVKDNRYYSHVCTVILNLEPTAGYLRLGKQLVWVCLKAIAWSRNSPA